MELSIIKQKFINLIVNYINSNNNTIELTEEETNKIIKFAKLHNIENLIHQSLKHNNTNVPLEFTKTCNTLFHKAITQDAELELIKEELINNKIYHLPLKGSILRNYYPTPELRSMADLDILVEKKDLLKIKNIMIELGYNFEKEGEDHDVYLKKPFMNVEMHREMIDEEYIYSSYYKNYIDKIKKESYTITLSNEDFYIYNIIHAGKHFSEGGTGIRVLIDIYYLLKKFNNINFDYIYNELKKIHLDIFAKELYNLTNYIFNQKELSENQIILLDFLIDSGTYGNITNFDSSKLVKENSKFKYILKRIFPSFKTLKSNYPKLNKYPILTPYYWFKRLFKVIFNKDRREKYTSGIKSTDIDTINRIKKVKEITKINN